MVKTIGITSLTELKKAVHEFIAILTQKVDFRSYLDNSVTTNQVNCIAFYGDMGAGKTTFIKELCRQLYAIDVANSPTFAIINEYQTKAEKPIFHFDFYRINHVNEAVNIGAEDYFYSGNLCLMEWPEKIEQILPQEVINVKIAEKTDGSREIQIANL